MTSSVLIPYHLTHSRYTVTIEWMNEWMRVSEWINTFFDLQQKSPTFLAPGTGFIDRAAGRQSAGGNESKASLTGLPLPVHGAGVGDLWSVVSGICLCFLQKGSYHTVCCNSFLHPIDPVSPVWRYPGKERKSILNSPLLTTIRQKGCCMNWQCSFSKQFWYLLEQSLAT